MNAKSNENGEINNPGRIDIDGSTKGGRSSNGLKGQVILDGSFILPCGDILNAEDAKARGANLGNGDNSDEDS